MEYRYNPEGVCSEEFIFQIEDDIVKELKIVGGCPGNTIGVSKLVAGKKIDEIIELLEGIPCGIKGTSCPDQIAKALIKYKETKRA
ncbi:MAG: TIGR03905 family TSCPD domain-containing protein [Clostridia bacterium]|nr:TIGR03905 family TSCPD domain-containing protein [Clostridia bacterium]